MHARPATPADIDEIVRLKQIIMTTAYPFEVDLDAHPDWPTRAAAAVAEMMTQAHHAFFVVDAPGSTPEQPRLAGCLSAAIVRYIPGPDWGARHGYLGDMCTDIPFRGQGLGRVLMDAALAWLREQGAESVRLEATPSAVPIYAAMGFEQHEAGRFATMTREL